MNNNIIPACIIGAGLFAVALKPASQPAQLPQAEPVAVATASVAGPSEPVIVWYGTENSRIYRAWSDGTVEVKLVAKNFDYRNDGEGGCEFFQQNDTRFCDYWTTDEWTVISSPQMACRTDINGNGEIEFGDLLAVLKQWGDQANCPDTVQLQCGLDLPNG